MKKLIISLLIISALLCSCGQGNDSFNMSDAQSIAEDTQASEGEASGDATYNESDNASKEEIRESSHGEIPESDWSETVNSGDEVHLCCFMRNKNGDEAEKYIGGAILKLQSNKLRFTDSDVICPQKIADELAKSVLGKDRYYDRIVIDDGEYEYSFRINMVNTAVKPSFTFPNGWDHRFSTTVGSFKEYGDDAGTVDSKDGELFGFEERLTLGCSAWCGCMEYICDISASSVLADQGKVSYKASHLAEADRKNVWSEGVEGVGIGESIEITQMYMGTGDKELCFNSICIVNGYAENMTKWQENCRVKSLKLYYGDEFMGVIELEDTIDPQYVDIAPLQMKVGNGFDASFRFEITEVYEGSKYEDTCLTGIIIDFTGIYAH